MKTCSFTVSAGRGCWIQSVSVQRSDSRQGRQPRRWSSAGKQQGESQAAHIPAGDRALVRVQASHESQGPEPLPA